MKFLNIFNNNKKVSEPVNLNIDKFLDTEINNTEDFFKYLAGYTILNNREVSDCFVIYESLKNLCGYKPIIKDVDKNEQRFKEIYWEYFNKYKNNEDDLNSVLHNIYKNNQNFKIICEHIYSCCYDVEINIYLCKVKNYREATKKNKEIRDTLKDYLNSMPFARVTTHSSYDGVQREQGLTQCELALTLPKTSNDYLKDLIEELSKIYPEASFEKYEIVRDPLKIKFN